MELAIKNAFLDGSIVPMVVLSSGPIAKIKANI
jgi:hypothetical protein